MIRSLLIAPSLLFLAATGCGKGAPCEDLAKRLCEASAEHCEQAGTWLQAQLAGEESTRDSVCATIIEEPTALAGYMTRFAASVAAKPAAAPAAPAPSADKPAETTRDKVREVGETIKEVGNAAEKAGEALDKVREAVEPEKH